MTLQNKLETLEEQYGIMVKYRSVCNSIGSLINYTSLDFDREGELLSKILETKDLINGKNKKSNDNAIS